PTAMTRVGRRMTHPLRPEIAHVQPAHVPRSHFAVAPRGGPHPAIAAEPHAADRRQAPAEIRVLAVKLDLLIEAADRLERVAMDGEVAAVQNCSETAHLTK